MATNDMIDIKSKRHIEILSVGIFIPKIRNSSIIEEKKFMVKRYSINVQLAFKMNIKLSYITYPRNVMHSALTVKG